MSTRLILKISLTLTVLIFVGLAVTLVLNCLEVEFLNANDQAEMGFTSAQEEATATLISKHGGGIGRKPGGPIRGVSFQYRDWFGDKDLEELSPHLAQLELLRGLNLAGTNISDEGLPALAGLKQLARLNLSHTHITDAGIKLLAQISSLQKLNLNRTRITNAALKELAGLKNLHELSLNETAITDTGLKELASLPQLYKLDLLDTQITPAAAADFRHALPECQLSTTPR